MRSSFACKNLRLLDRKHHRIIFAGHHYHCFFPRCQPSNVQRIPAGFPPRFMFIHFHTMSLQHVQKISIILLHDRIRNYRWPTIISGPHMYQAIHTIFIDDCSVIARSYALSIVYHRWERNLTNTDVYTIDCITSSRSTYRSSYYCVKIVECSIKPKYERLQLGKFHGDHQSDNFSIGGKHSNVERRCTRPARYQPLTMRLTFPSNFSSKGNIFVRQLVAKLHSTRSKFKTAKPEASRSPSSCSLLILSSMIRKETEEDWKSKCLPRLTAVKIQSDVTSAYIIEE